MKLLDLYGIIYSMVLKKVVIIIIISESMTMVEVMVLIRI